MNESIELIKIRLLDLVNIKTEDMMFRRINGLDWPQNAFTMVGIRRLDNIEFCINQIIEKNIEGGFIETGVWKGGCCILMASILKIKGVERDIYVADIFDGDFPVPVHEQDNWAAEHDFSQLACSLDQVKSNFQQFGVLGPNIHFKKGWFKDTLPTIEGKLSLIRLDGDMYDSTMDGLVNLYDKLSDGGFVILDDWAITSSKNAVLDFFKERKIEKEIHHIDSMGAYFIK